MRDEERSRSPIAQSERTSGGRTSGGTKSGNPLERMSVKATSIREQLTVASVLSGKKSGQDLFQADRVQQALAKSDGKASEAVSLKAHLDVIRAASQVSASNIDSVKKDSRDRLLAQVCPHVREDFPEVWKVALLRVVVRDMKLCSRETVAAWVDCISPRAHGGDA